MNDKAIVKAKPHHWQVVALIGKESPLGAIPAGVRLEERQEEGEPEERSVTETPPGPELKRSGNSNREKLTIGFSPRKSLSRGVGHVYHFSSLALGLLASAVIASGGSDRGVSGEFLNRRTVCSCVP